jgi:hypothetical protein
MGTSVSVGVIVKAYAASGCHAKHAAAAAPQILFSADRRTGIIMSLLARSAWRANYLSIACA